MLVERKPVAPSLLTDPAFSTNPHAHPYATTSHVGDWLSSPPAGHPALRRRRQADILASDSEPFHIIPPPNSPVNVLEGVTTFSVLDQAQKALPTATADPISKLEKSHQAPASDLSPAPPLTPPTARRPSVTRFSLMTLLKRRSNQQPQGSLSVNTKQRKESISLKSVFNTADVSRLLLPRTTQPNIERQDISPLPDTLGNSTPPVPYASATHPAPRRRVTDVHPDHIENLDRIDELDETNPWGIGFHHGGPYEAAAQIMRGKEQPIIPGHGSYNRGVPATNDNIYSPPQATRLALNLSPGQILPRNYQSRRISPQVQNSLAPPTAVMMKPASQSLSRPSRVAPPLRSATTLPPRRQSYQTLSMIPPRLGQPRRQSLNPTPATSQATLPLSPLPLSITLPQPQQLHPFATPATNPQPFFPQSSSNFSHTSPNRVPEVAVSPTNLVSIGIGMLEDDSDEEEELGNSSSVSLPSTTPDHEKEIPKGVSTLQKPFPQAARLEDDRPIRPSRDGMSSSVSVDTHPQQSREKLFDLPKESPPPYSHAINKTVHETDLGHLRTIVSSHPSPSNSSQGLGSIVPSNMVPAVLNLQDAPSLSRGPYRTSTQNAFGSQGSNSTSSRTLEDNSSVHPSVSSKSSSSRSSGPPSARHVPKHLVMPTPLAPSVASSTQYQQRSAPAQQSFRPPRQNQPPPSAFVALSSESMPPTQIFVKAQAQDIHFSPSKTSKLKKRTSLMGHASQIDAATTVSFAPPIIGFNNSVTQETSLRRIVTERFTHKNVLSKRRSEW